MRNKHQSRSSSPPPTTPMANTTCETNHGLAEWWETLPSARKRELLSVTQGQITQKLRLVCCSGCFSLTMKRYKEMCSKSSGDMRSELEVGSNCWRLKDDLVHQPWSTIARSSTARNLAHQKVLNSQGVPMEGATCGTGWRKRNGRSGMCALHTIRHPAEGLMNHLQTVDHTARASLFKMSEEDYLAELDAQLRHTLRVCSECRSNVTRAYRDLKLGTSIDVCCECCERSEKTHTMTLMPGVLLEAKQGSVRLIHASGMDDDLLCVIEYAQDLEDEQMSDSDCDGEGFSDRVRHAETPCAAREALNDATCLIFKQQVERNLTSQLVWYNALLHLEDLALDIMHEEVQTAYKELSAQRATEELLQMLDEEQECVKSKTSKKAKKKKAKRAAAAAAAAAAATEGDDCGEEVGGGHHAGGSGGGGGGSSKAGSEGDAHPPDQDQEEEEEEVVEDTSPMQLLERAVQEQARLVESFARHNGGGSSGGGNIGGKKDTSNVVVGGARKDPGKVAASAHTHHHPHTQHYPQQRNGKTHQEARGVSQPRAVPIPLSGTSPERGGMHKGYPRAVSYGGSPASSDGMTVKQPRVVAVPIPVYDGARHPPAPQHNAHQQHKEGVPTAPPRVVTVPVPTVMEIKQPRTAGGGAATPPPRGPPPPPPRAVAVPIKSPTRIPVIKTPRGVEMPTVQSTQVVGAGVSGGVLGVPQAHGVGDPLGGALGGRAPQEGPQSSFSLFGPYSVAWIDPMGINNNGQPAVNGMHGHPNEALQGRLL